MNTTIFGKSFFVDSSIISKGISTAFIFICANIAVKFFGILLRRWQKLVLRKTRGSLEAASAVETEFTIIKRTVIAGIYFFALILVLLQFDAVRSLGAGLLASAGLASIVIGLAAQNTLSNIIAGISISFSQPFRLRDAVIFENEFGHIEEISLTHTTILTWDNRRIIVPNNVIANKTVENWTIKDPTLLGSINFYVDYGCDVEKVRVWVKEIVATSQNSTSEKLAVVQVTDFTENSMALRILVKGPDAAKTWDLRCEVREGLIKRFKQANLPLPQTRIKITPPAAN